MVNRPDFVLCILSSVEPCETLCGRNVLEEAGIASFADVGEWMTVVRSSNAKHFGCPECVKAVLEAVRANFLELQCRVQPHFREEVQRYRELQASNRLELRRGFSFDVKKQRDYGIGPDAYAICTRDDPKGPWSITIVDLEEWERVHGIVKGVGAF